MFDGPKGVVVEPTDWFRIRHADPFPPEAIAAFNASCAVYRAKVEAILQHWDALPTIRTHQKPVVVFFDPEVSGDGRVLSLPMRIENQTLGSRSLFQSTATRELHSYLPISVMIGIEVGLSEPALQGAGVRHDWWNPHKDNSVGPEEAFRKQGFTLEPDPAGTGSILIPGWRRRLQWLFAGLRRH